MFGRRLATALAHRLFDQMSQNPLDRFVARFVFFYSNSRTNPVIVSALWQHASSTAINSYRDVVTSQFPRAKTNANNNAALGRFILL